MCSRRANPFIFSERSYTTLVGMFGAAMGLDLPSSYRYAAEKRLRFGAGGWHEGQARDLWKFQKLELSEERKEFRTDVLLREHWIDSRLVLLVETPDEPTAERIAEHYLRPAFPLTAGPSDALMKVVAARVEHIDPVAERRIAHALVYGEINPNYGLYEDVAKMPLSRVVRAPSVESLPTGFIFEEGSPRRLEGRSLVTFVADPIILDDGSEPVVGYSVTPQSAFLHQSPVFKTWKDGLPWIIPVHRYESKPPAETSSTTPSPNEKTSKRASKNKPIDNT